MGSRDIRDETLLRTDFRPGVLPTEQPAPSAVTTLRRWTVHFDASTDGRPKSVTSTATLPPGTAVSGVDVEGGDASTCPNQTVYLSLNGRNPFLSAYRAAGPDWAARGYAPDSVMSGSPDTLQAGV